MTDVPDLMINADFSHFCVVSEGDMTASPGDAPDDSGIIPVLPDPRKDSMMEIAITRADHIHARVGDAHRPQCWDPRVGEGLKWTKHFEGWWDRSSVQAARKTVSENYAIRPTEVVTQIEMVPRDTIVMESR